MPGRVNTRFVLILSAVLCAITGAVAFAYFYFVVRMDPGPNLERAEAMLQAGDIAGAAEQLGRAYRKQQSDVNLLLRYIETVEQIESEDRQQAGIHLQTIMNGRASATMLRPTDEKLLGDYFEMERELRSWERMAQTANDRLKTYPDLLVARKYRGIAQVNRMAAGLTMNEEEREQPRQDLTQVLMQNPNDVLTHYHLALWHVLQADHHNRPGGDVDQVEPLRAEALKLTQQLAEQHGDNPEAMEYVVRLYVSLQERNAAAEVLERLEAAMLNKPEPVDRVVATADLIRTLKTGTVQQPQGQTLPAGVVGAIQLLETALAKDPRNLQLKVPLARWLMLSNQYDRAMELLKEVRATKVKAKPFEALRAFSLHDLGTMLYCDLVLRRLDDNDPAARESALQEVQTLVDAITRINPGLEGWTRALRARVYLAQGSVARAADAMDEAIAAMRSGRGGDVFLLTEAYLISAQLRSQLGHWGAAANSYRELMTIRPDLQHLRLQLAETHLRGQQLFDAERVLQAVLTDEPNHAVARLLLGQLRTMQERYDDAIAIYQALLKDEATQDNLRVDVVTNLAQTYARANREEDARKLIDAEFAKNASNPRLLQLALSLSQDNVQKDKYTQMAREAGVDSQLLDVLERVADNPEELIRIAEEQATKISDPFTRHLQLYTLYGRVGDEEKARANFEAAAKLKPNDPRIIEVQFNEALTNRNWDRASQLATKAREVDADLAGGMYYLGLLEAAQGKHSRAIANFQTALRSREKFPDAWHRLGVSQAETGDLTAATNSFTQALNQQPDHVGAILGLADVQSRLGNHAQALEHLRRAARSNPNNAALQDQYLRYEQQYGDKNLALQRRLQMLERQPNNMSNRRSLALLYADMGESDKAIATVNELIEKDGLNLTNAEVQAQVLLNLGQAEAAMRALNAYLSHRGHNASAEDWMALGRLRWVLGLEEPSLEAFEEARRLEDPQSRPATRTLAVLMQQIGRHDRYIELLEVLAKDDPNDHQLAQTQAVALASVGRADEAQRALDRIGEQYRHDIGTLQARAAIAMARKDYRTAVTILTQAIEREPNRPVLYFQRAEARLGTGAEQVTTNDIAQAQRDLEEAARLNPSFHQARRRLAQLHLTQNRLEPALAELRSILEREPRSLNDRLQLANLLMQSQRWLELNTVLEESVRLFPNQAIWVQMQGRAAVQQQQLDRALDRFTQAMALQPNAVHLAELVGLLLEVRQAQQALSLLDQHAQIATPEPVLRAMRARALALLQRDDDAVAEFNAALGMCGSELALREVMNQLRRTWGSRRAVELAAAVFPVESANAQTVWAQLVIADEEGSPMQSDFAAVQRRVRAIEGMVGQDSPYRLRVDRMLGMAAHMLNQHAEAVARYQSVLAREPNDPAMLNNLAYILCENLNQPQQALPYAQRAAELAADEASVLDTLGWVQFRSGQVSQGIQTLRRALEISPLPDTYYHLGEIYRQQDALDDARQMYESAQQLADRRGQTDISEKSRQRLEELRR